MIERVRAWVTPSFSDLEVFVVAYAMLLTIATFSTELLGAFIRFWTVETGSVSNTFAVGVGATATLIIAFIVLGVHHVFSARKKLFFEKMVLLVFMLIVSVLFTVLLILSPKEGVFGMFILVWNALHLYVLVTWVSHSYRDIEHMAQQVIQDSYVSRNHIIFASYISLALYVVLAYVYTLSWYVVFASLIVLVTPLTQAIGHVLDSFEREGGSSENGIKTYIVVFLPLLLAGALGAIQ